MNHLALRHLRVQARTDRAPEYLPKPSLSPALPYPRQARMIRQLILQPVADEPPDREVHLRLAHQPTVVHEPQQKARQHQPNRHFRVDPGTTVVRAITIRHLLAQPAQVQNPVHAGQNVILGNQLLQRTGHEQVHLGAVPASQHRGYSLLGRVDI